MQLKINKLAAKIFIYPNVIIILLSMLLYLIIPPQFEEYILKEKEDVLKQLNQMLSEDTEFYLFKLYSYQHGIQGLKGTLDVIKTELLNHFQTNPDFVYYALISKQQEGLAKELFIYNKEKMLLVEELLEYEPDETIIKNKAGMLNVITPIVTKHEGKEIKLGYLRSGFSLKDQEDELKKVEYAIFIICGFFILFGNLWGYIQYRLITTPLKQSTELIKKVVQGDLTGMVKSKSKDELSNLIQTLNAMVDTWRGKVKKIKIVIKSSHAVSSEISIAASQQEKITDRQSHSINEIAVTIEELNTNSKLVHKKAEAVEERSEMLLQVSLDGQESVNKSIETFAIIRENVKTIAEYVLDLSEEAQQVGIILKEVNSIARQTDMLAINAGIRAAKVKEHGKQFAIIATEIRDLANQSQMYAAKISSLIERIQTSTHSTVIAMEQGIKEVEEGITLILEAGKTIETAIINFKETVDSVHEISLSSHQQFLGTNQVTQSVVSINQGMKETAVSSKHTLRETEALNEVHQELLQVISSYKV